jgi:benzoyl-CoA reductase/2-hydroxyglutaryl-CoA dehydratase subunit BcrC/BadD/HgdB
MRDSDTISQQFSKIEADFIAQTQKPHIGVMCLRTPIELIEALDAIPVRIKSEPVIEPDGSFGIRNDACSFCRSIPDSLKLDRYKNLSAIIGGACCDQMRRLMDTLSANLSIPVLLFGAPRTWGTDEQYFSGEMQRAFNQLSEILGKDINKGHLRILITERSALRQKVKDLRDTDSLPTRLLRQISSSPLPAADIISFLENISIEKPDNQSVRLALLGSIPSGKELDIIEDMGAMVVADLTCLGDRAFRLMETMDDDPLRALYLHYIENNLCPHRRPYDKLIEYTKVMIALRKVDGVIYRSVKYCHPFGLSAQRFRKELDLPFLELDDDLTLQAIGSFRTRIGAFLETLEARLRRAR